MADAPVVGTRFVTSGGGTTFTPTFTTNDTDSWLMVVAASHDSSTSPSPAITGLDGFTSRVDSDCGGVGSSVRLFVGTKKSTGAETDMTLTFASNIKGVAYGVVLDGLDGTDLIDIIGSITVASAASPVAPSITTSAANELVLAFGARDDDDISDPPPSQGSYIISDSASDVGSNGLSLMVASFTQVAAGATGATTLNWGGSAEDYSAVQIAFTDASGADVTAPTHGVGSLKAGHTRDLTMQVLDLNDDQAATVDLHGVVIPAADTTPSAAQVRDGQDDGGTPLAAGLTDSTTVGTLPATGENDFTSVPGDADQKYCYTVEDPTGNLSTVTTVNIPAPGSGTGDTEVLIAETTVASFVDNTNFALTDHPGRADSWNDYILYLIKAGDVYDVSHARITDIDVSGNVVVSWLTPAPATVATSDVIRIEPSNATVAVTQLDVADMTQALKDDLVQDVASAANLSTIGSDVDALAVDLTATKAVTDSLTVSAQGVEADLVGVHGDALGATKPHDTP